ncbi:MAG: hypothetical protein ABEI13_00945 [Candidatus Paceibacteria bacterium]
MMRGKIHNKRFTCDDIESLDLYEKMKNNQELKENVEEFCWMYVSKEKNIIEEREDLINHVSVMLEKFGKESTGDLQTAMEFLSDSNPEAAKQCIAIKIIINGK